MQITKVGGYNFDGLCKCDPTSDSEVCSEMKYRASKNVRQPFLMTKSFLFVYPDDWVLDDIHRTYAFGVDVLSADSDIMLTDVKSKERDAFRGSVSVVPSSSLVFRKQTHRHYLHGQTSYSPPSHVAANTTFSRIDSLQHCQMPLAAFCRMLALLYGL